MILYFTGTGNSRFAADVLAEELGDTCVSLNDVLKNNTPAEFHSETPFIVVAPVYAWRLPRVVEKLLRRADFTGSRKAYFVATMGSESGSCDKYCARVCKDRKLEFGGFRGVSMPSNYVVADVMPKEEEVRKKLRQAVPELREIAGIIGRGETLQRTDDTGRADLKSGIINRFFVKFTSSVQYIVSAQCTSCGNCEKNCPVNNITIKNGKPVFGDHCINCYSCIQRCPAEAIDIRGKTETHGRYVCPEYHRADFE